MLRYQEKKHRAEFVKVRESRPDLAMLVYAIAGWLDDEYGIDAHITAVLKPGFHATGRAVDLDIVLDDANQSGTDDDETAPVLNEIRDWINKYTHYGLKNNGKPGETIPAIDHGTGLHLHVQVPGGRAVKLVLPV